jgi:hypothetical protein
MMYEEDLMSYFKDLFNHIFGLFSAYEILVSHGSEDVDVDLGCIEPWRWRLFFRNVGKDLEVHTTSQLKRPPS